MEGGRMRIGGLAGTVVMIWLLIGVFAAWQRDYFRGSQTSCATAGTIAVTVLAGPLNYAGVKPVVSDCRLPQPSSLDAVSYIV
ncbi:hypothetical protein MTER_10030 [Mycolicibacter terrae]|jgi:hypothetical protein|uniref:Uncharacterized protein n=2 Tax=Mycolicibacter terrae TaxID=1788 RepID=A0AAD1HU82_9MYCO|nr:hypothetical protein AWC28_17050 [Mycolicibacter terrae]BBX21592.1 hypothetical protein MTER_10030 [Mycolicibacter terrae]